LIAERKLGGVANGGLIGRGRNFANERSQLFENVIDGLHELGTVAEQAVAASAGQTVDRA
jgi:hypothetical protein